MAINRAAQFDRKQLHSLFNGYIVWVFRRPLPLVQNMSCFVKSGKMPKERAGRDLRITVELERVRREGVNYFRKRWCMPKFASKLFSITNTKRALGIRKLGTKNKEMTLNFLIDMKKVQYFVFGKYQRSGLGTKSDFIKF